MREPTFFTPPDPAATRRHLSITVAFLGALLAHPALAHEHMVAEQTRPPWAWGIVAAWTAVASVVHLRVASGAESLKGVAVRGIALGVSLGLLNSALSLGTITFLRTGRLEDGVAGFFMGGFFGAPVGGLTGLAFGLGYLPLVALAVADRKAPTHEGRDLAWMASGLAVVIAAFLRDALLPEALGLQGLAAAGGAACLLVGANGAARRRLFVARVRSGRVADWAIDALPDPPTCAGLFPATGGTTSSVLYRAAELGNGPYRAASGWTPVARISAAGSG